MENLSRPYLRTNWFIYVVFLLRTMAPSISTACEICSDVWTKVFETDSTGSVVVGNLTEVKAAVVMGAHVRFVLPDWGDAGYAGDVDSVRVQDPLSEHICAQSLKHVGKNGWDKFPDDVYWSYKLICTSGNTEENTYKVGSNSFETRNTKTSTVQWFIREPVSQIALLFHLNDGSPVSGNTDTIINAVQSGYDITVYSSSQPFTLSNVNISSSFMVFGEHITIEMFSTTAFSTFTVLSTLGVIDMSVWTLNGGRPISNSTFSASMSWFGDPCWCEVYTHDENGNPQSGSVEELVSAVEGGHRVKIGVGSFSIEAANVRTKGGQVSAQLLDQLSQKDENLLEEDPSWIWQMAHSTGTILTRRYYVSQGNFTSAGDTTESKAISWFVDTHTWTKVLSTKAYGGVKSGSKTELTAAVRNGAAVRVALKFRDGRRTGRGRGGGRGWFVMNADNVELTSCGEVAVQLTTVVRTEEVEHEEFQITDDPCWRFMVVTTQGNVETSLWKAGEHLNDGRLSEKADVNWFVSY